MEIVPDAGWLSKVDSDCSDRKTFRSSKTGKIMNPLLLVIRPRCFECDVISNTFFAIFNNKNFLEIDSFHYLLFQCKEKKASTRKFFLPVKGDSINLSRNVSFPTECWWKTPELVRTSFQTAILVLRYIRSNFLWKYTIWGTWNRQLLPSNSIPHREIRCPLY